MDIAGLSNERVQSQAAVDGKLLVQDAELQQLRPGLTDLSAQARRAETPTTQQLEHRTKIVLDAMTEHFDIVFDDVKAELWTGRFKAKPTSFIGRRRTSRARLG